MQHGKDQHLAGSLQVKDEPGVGCASGTDTMEIAARACAVGEEQKQNLWDTAQRCRHHRGRQANGSGFTAGQ
jgi:hypothetical protein